MKNRSSAPVVLLILALGAGLFAVPAAALTGPCGANGKLWIAALRSPRYSPRRPRLVASGIPYPFYESTERPRYHATAWDNGAIWQIIGNDCKNHTEYREALVKYEAATGRAIEVVEFEPGSADPHGLAMHDGAFISCDAGISSGLGE
jgi:hypothetical protein